MVPPPTLSPDFLAFRQTFLPLGLSPIPSTTSFLAHPDLRVPSIIALFLLLLASGKMAARLIITRENWDRVRAMGWFRRPEVEDDEKKLRDQETRLGEGRGGTRGVERWREQIFGKQAEGEEGVRDCGHLIAIFTLDLFFFALPTLGSLLSFAPGQESWCGFLGLASFVYLAGARYAALFKVSLDLEQARGEIGRERPEGWRGRLRTGGAAMRWEVLAVRAFIWVGVVMSLFSATFSLGFLIRLPDPFTSTALCFRMSYRLYAIPLGLNLALTLYSLARIFLVSHFDTSSRAIVIDDGRMRRGTVLAVWMVATFAQEIGVGESEGSRMWLPMCLGAWAMMSVIEKPPYIAPPPPPPTSTPYPPSSHSRDPSGATLGRRLSSILPSHTPTPPTTLRTQPKVPPLPTEPHRSPTILRVGIGGDGRPGHKARSEHSLGDRSLGESLKEAEVQMAFRQNFGLPPATQMRTSGVESIAQSDIVNQAATEPSTVFQAPSVASPVTLYSEVVHRTSKPASNGGREAWEMMLGPGGFPSETSSDDSSFATPSAPRARPPVEKGGPGLTLPTRAEPTRPRSLHDSVNLNGETKVLRQSQQVYAVPRYAIPRPLSESTQGAMTVSTGTNTNRVFGSKPAPIRTSRAMAMRESSTGIELDTTTPKDPPRRTIVVDETDLLSPSIVSPSPSSRPSSDTSLNSLAASSDRPLSTKSNTNRTFGPTPSRTASSAGHGRKKSDGHSIRSIPPPPGPPPITALPPPPPGAAPPVSQAALDEKRTKRASSPPPFSMGLPANPRKGPPAPPKDRVPPGSFAAAAVESEAKRASERSSAGGGVAPRITLYDHSSAGIGGSQSRLGSGSLGSFKF